MKRLMLIAIYLVTISFSSAKDIYVAKNGNDNNTGTQAQPYLTISKAAQVAVAGDVVLIKAGVYRETVTPSNNGTAGNPIVFKTFGSDEVTISATDEVKNWSVHNGSIYKATATMPLNTRNMLYYNGVAMDLARWPNNTDDNKYSIDAESVTAGSASHIEASNILDIDWSGGYMWYLGAHSGASWTRAITSSSASRVDFTAVDITKWPFNPHNPTVFRNGNRGRFYLMNALGALDYDREWFYENNTIYFKAPSGANPNNAILEYAAREKTINITKQYIQFEGINAFGGEVNIAGKFAVLKKGNFKHCLEMIDNLNNTSAQIGNGSITAAAESVTIENNIIEYGSSNGIMVRNNAPNSIIQNNIIRHFNTIGNHSSLIRSTSKNVKVLNNTAYSSGRDGLYVNSYDCEVAYNNVYEVMKINNDGGVYYTVGNEDLRNTEIHHNWFHDSKGPEYADGRCAGIYLDNDSKGYDVHHNVVWNVTWAGIQTNWDVWDNEIYNNTIWNVSDAMGAWLPVRDGYQTTIQRTKIYNNYASIKEFLGTDLQNNIINASSPFQDEVAQNFMPKSGSVLIDAGIEIPNFTDGFVGSKPDVGAYEFGGTQWTAGAEIVGFCSSTWYEDTDDDGLGDVNVFVEACTQPSGFVATSGDFCLNDPLKTVPGDCGCNVPEAACNEEIAFTQSITTVPSVKNIAVDLDYVVSEQRDLVLVLLDGNGAWVGNEIVTVEAGSGTQRMTITLNDAPTVGPSYRLDAYIRPVGGDFSTNIKSATVNVTVVAAGAKDCAGVADGIAMVDACGVCSGGTTNIAVKNTNCSATESIDFNDDVTSYPSQNTISVEVSYTTNQERDIVVILNSPTGTWLGNGVKTVAAGSGTTTVTVNLATAPPAGQNYNSVITLREKGGDWSTNVATKNRLVEIALVTNVLEDGGVNVNAFPNPTTGKVQLSVVSEFQVFNTIGVLIVQGEGATVDLSNQESGVYLIKTGVHTHRIFKL